MPKQNPFDKPRIPRNYSIQVETAQKIQRLAAEHGMTMGGLIDKAIALLEKELVAKSAQNS